jgi:hypothetical protein
MEEKKDNIEQNNKNNVTPISLPQIKIYTPYIFEIYDKIMSIIDVQQTSPLEKK